MKHAGSVVEAERGSARAPLDRPVRILHLEDNLNDAELVRDMLDNDGLHCEIVRIETRAEFADALDRQRFDLVISDFTLPSYDGRAALLLAREKSPDTPVLFFSGTLGEESAIQALKAGATDCVLKQRPARFVSAVRRALHEAKEQATHKRTEKAMRKDQERFKSIYESSKDAIAYSTIDGLLLDMNDSFLKLTRYTREEILMKTYQNLTPMEYRKLEGDIIQNVVRTGEPAEYEKEYIRKDGSLVAVSLTVFVVKDREGQPDGLAQIVKDITKRKRLEEQFRQAQKMEAVGQLTSGIAHDFNNLLTVINGYSEMTLQALKADDPLRSNIEQVKEAGARAAALTRQLLAFSRKQVLEPKVLDLNAVVTNIDKMLTRTIGEDIDLVAALTPGLGRVKADPGQIEQVIMNLATNARDAMPDGGMLTIETANVELDAAYAQMHMAITPGRYVMLAVSDTGCGIDAETQRRIFEPFFTTKEQGKGTGLGLATVYGIVKQSGGSIWVYSEPGHGTTFKIYLPRVEAPTEAVEPDTARARPPNGTETILLVEDAAGVRSLARAALQVYGYSVLEAANGNETIALSEQYQGVIHLLVTDVVMPGMNGRALAERLTTRLPQMKVLYVSGYTDDTIVRHGMLDAGMAFLQKPFTPLALARKVREMLDAPPKQD